MSPSHQSPECHAGEGASRAKLLRDIIFLPPSSSSPPSPLMLPCSPSSIDGRCDVRYQQNVGQETEGCHKSWWPGRQALFQAWVLS